MIGKGILEAKLVTPKKIDLFWNTSDLPLKVIQYYFNCRLEKLSQVMRIYDVSHIIFNGNNAHHFFEISVPFHKGNWTVKGLVPNRNYIVEIGVKITANDFFPLLRSNSVHTAMVDDPNDREYTFISPSNQQYGDQQPDWADHVSTYSYYNGSIYGGRK
jgi:uncharacterized protein